ncbi:MULTISPECIES: MFS transporter [Rhizobium/Agrobacterium group]|uniref:MFS permease n=2 Tax=Rhizobium/Agrobacterium group TaxID=227290 RepID=B9JXN3_ALLAM|nr:MULTISPECIES: MFS transporter [Rhizobium/Agrobacterium group]ACM37010.1 MFS permease [Allorhizobium ampelinum S4]MUO29843.1 MFS transporter [Agrobacterium vitis]MUO42207.1 MFS transporter [Agrobacterium vitis]MUP10878.1 MFS transporter [Agrobacterium vitis]
MTLSSPLLRHDAEHALSPALTFIFALACGLIAANLYYGQPLAGPISADLGFSPQATGLIVTLTQLGYCLGLLLLVPLGDLIENRKLVIILIGLAALALLGGALSTTPGLFLLACLGIGLASAAAQVLVPFAASMAPDASRGRVVGNVMSGLLCGIMLARPIASFIAEASSWHVIYVLSALAMIGLMVVLGVTLPRRQPHAQIGYGVLLSSMAHMALTNRVLQRRALYQAGMFGAFSLFWTTTPLLLSGPHFGLSQNGIALFALAGASGAIASPIAGRMADRGLTREISIGAMVLGIGAFLLGRYAIETSPITGVICLTLAAITLDFGVQANLISGQRIIYSMTAAHRSRLNGLYMATFFLGGALGSAIGGWAYATGGWSLTAWIGLCFPAASLVLLLTERRQTAKV